MNEELSKDITEEELGKAREVMAKGKTPRHDGIPMEFFQKLWHIVGHDYHKMILTRIEKGALHEGVTKGLISLIPKEKDLKNLNNWRPITLLTTTYNFSAKALQLRLQPMLNDFSTT